MKEKTIVKITLNVVMLIVLVVLFSKNVISMAFHEIAGLAIIGVFISHVRFTGEPQTQEATQMTEETQTAQTDENAARDETAGETQNAAPGGKSRRAQQPFSLGNLFAVMGTYFSIAFVFVTATVLLEKRFKRKRRARAACPAAS